MGSPAPPLERIPKNPGFKGLYPCGEGAGYAGGIVSAAIDGEKCAVVVCSYSYYKN
jgi:uncharacterized FAD-dependent dehydrogenase